MKDDTNSVNNIRLNGDDLISNPLEDLLLNLKLINYICVYMLIILFIQILFKLYFFFNSLRLKLSSILGNRINYNLEFYKNKIIILKKKNI